MQRFVPIAVAALMLATVPTGLATWFSSGDFEPNTFYDDPSLMFPDPSESGKKVYFNGFTSFAYYGPNPNVAAIRSQNEMPGAEAYWAILGVWVDCNGDGYIGMAEGALREYPAELLETAAENHCPLSTGGQNRWDGSHNYNGWVSELIPIGNGQADFETDARQFSDNDTMVWADFGRPDESSTTAGGSCPIDPQPRGTWQSTGGFLNYADCLTTAMDVVNLATADGYTLAGQDVPGPGDPAGIRFDDPDDARGHPVWDHPTFGSEDSANSAVHVVDCNADEPLFSVGDSVGVNDTLNDAGLNVLPELGPAIDETEVPAIAPAVGDPTGMTVPGQVNETDAELGDCDPTDSSEGPFYGTLEDDNPPVPIVGKDTAAYNFNYFSHVRGVTNPASPGWTGDGGADAFGGQGVLPVLQGAEWTPQAILFKEWQTVALRTSLANGTADPGPAGAYWLTYYARIGQSVLDLGVQLPGGSGFYGAAQCGGADSGIENGWQCDRDLWNLDGLGNPTSSVHPLAAVGDVYQLRDVDCQDGGNDLGVGTGVPFYGEEACSTFG